ncbi:MAG TPA: F0F1 ATP synthase subunit epsilon [Acidimicrobiales bacterium]|nr:F0F1 ATP synthase subunit epsilon [Acidimicrobiales bacterium]
MATPFHVELVTPERVLYSGEVSEVSMRTDAGEIAFLAHHEDFIAGAGVTVVRLTTAGAGEETAVVRAAVHGGFVHFDQDSNRLEILAGVAELGGAIDVDRARRSLERAEAAAAGAPEHGTAAASLDESASAHGAPMSGTMLAMLAPDEPAAVAQRARVRLEAAEAPPAR